MIHSASNAFPGGGGAWDERISSVRVPAGFKVTLYDVLFRYSTLSRVITADANLGDHGFDDMTSSFIVERRQERAHPSKGDPSRSALVSSG
ncbi:hypothetical protein WME91_38575 [Sorangium sp. So ce269]